jgi:hypothetical protein
VQFLVVLFLACFLAQCIVSVIMVKACDALLLKVKRGSFYSLDGFLTFVDWLYKVR